MTTFSGRAGVIKIWWGKSTWGDFPRWGDEQIFS